MKSINNFEKEETMTLEKPTLEEYEKAKQEYKTYCAWVSLAREKKNGLVDALAIERENEIFYSKQAEKQYEIIRCYEIYEQVEKGGVKQ